MGGRLAGQLVVLGIGLAPVVLAAITWTPHGPEPWMWPVRSYAAPVLVSEIATILVATATGLPDTLRALRPPRPALIAAAVLAIVMVGTVPFAPVPEAAAASTAFWVIHLGFALSVMHLTGRLFTPGDLVRSYAIGFLLFTGVFAVLLSQVRDPGFDWVHDLPGFVNVRIISHYAAPAAALAAGIMALSNRPVSWVGGFALAVAAFGLALWTGSRGALIGTGAALVAGLLFTTAVRRPRAWAGLAGGVAVAWLAVSALPTPAKNMGPARIATATIKSSNATTGRTELWAKAAKAVAERPVFGHGESQLRFVAQFADVLHPHNVILQVLLAWGAVGLACVLTLAFYFARASIRLVRSGADELVPPFLAMVALAVPSMIDGSLYHLLPVSIFAACAGLIGASLVRTESPG